MKPTFICQYFMHFQTYWFSVWVLPEVSVTVARWRHADVVLVRAVTTQTAIATRSVIMNRLRERQMWSKRKPAAQMCFTTVDMPHMKQNVSLVDLVISHLQEELVDHGLQLFNVLTHDWLLSVTPCSKNILIQRSTTEKTHINKWCCMCKCECLDTETTGTFMSRRLRANFVPANDEGHLTAPRVDEAGPAGVQGDVVTVLTPEPDGWVFERRLACVLQNWGDHDKFY